MLITIHDANLQTVGWIDNDKLDTLNYYNDAWTRYLETGASTFEFTVFKRAIKSDSGHERAYNLLHDRAFVSFVYKGEPYVFSVMELEEDEHTIHIVAEDLNLELINEKANAYKATRAMTLAEYCKAMDLINFTMLTIGVNELEGQSRTLEWEGRDTKLARLISLATKFDAEIEFKTELNRDGSIKSFRVNFYKENDGVNQGVGKVRGDIRLVYGKNLESVTRSIDKRDVINAIMPVGKDGLTIAGMPAWEQKNERGEVEFYQSGAMLYAPLSMQRYPAVFSNDANRDKWTREDMDVETESKETLRATGIRRLRKVAYPAITYTLKGFIDADIGDTITVEDSGFTPMLILSARVAKQKISFTNPDNNQTEFDNFKALENRLSDGIQAALERAIENAKTYTVNIATDNGVIFKNQLGETTITPSLYRGSTPVPHNVSWNWFKDGVYHKSGQTYLLRASDFTDTLVIKAVAMVDGVPVAERDTSFVNVSDGRPGINGAQGVPGPPGKDGQATYTHVAYADTADGRERFSISEGNRRYMGILIDNNLEDSRDPSLYTWSLIKGADGDKGVPGAKGADGRTPYFHTAYANNPSGTEKFSLTDPTGRAYIGHYTDYTQADSTNPSAYTWYLAKGADGKDGRGVANVKTYYLATTASSGVTHNTAGWTTTPQQITEAVPCLWTYRVEEYTDGETARALPALTGSHGRRGIQGTRGADGQTLYTWLKYADSPISGMSDTPDGKMYVGFAYNKTTATESTNYSDYSWSLIKGEDGPAGPKGENGRTLYTWTKYAEDANGKNMSDDPAGKRYLGLAINRATASKSTNPADYSWSPLYDNVNGGGNLLRNSSFRKNTEEWNIDGQVEQSTGAVIVNGILGRQIVVWQSILEEIMEDDRGQEYTAIATIEATNIQKGPTNPMLELYVSGARKNGSWYGGLVTEKIPLESYGNEKKRFVGLKFKVNEDRKNLERFRFNLYFRDFTGQVKVSDVFLTRSNFKKEWEPHRDDIDRELSTKADNILTQEQLNALSEKQALLEQETQAKADASVLMEWQKRYNDYVEADIKNRDESERKLLEVTRRVEAITNDLGDMAERWNFIDTYMKASNEGLVIGRKDGTSSIRIDDNRIGMYSGNNEVMYITQGVLHIDNGVFTKTLQVGRFVEAQHETNLDTNVVRYVG